MGKVLIVDCFPFFNELDVLEVRLNTLAPYVDRFVVVESPFTYSRKAKPLVFLENQERFKDFPIVHLINPYMECEIEDPRVAAWELYHQALDYLMYGLHDVDDDATILLSDVDEIPALTYFKEGMVGVFKQRLYYYYFNVYTGNRNWSGPVAIKKKDIKDMRTVRETRGLQPSTRCSGWHFSYIGTTESAQYKVESFAHQELNKPEILEKMVENRKNLKDPFNRHDRIYQIIDPSGPAWLLENKEKYRHLWYNG